MEALMRQSAMRETTRISGECPVHGPYTAFRWSDPITGEIYDSKSDLNAFFHEYAIYPGLPLAEAITTRYKEMVSGVAANPLLSQDFFDRFRKTED